jgi:hypothetical protein
MRVILATCGGAEAGGRAQRLEEFATNIARNVERVEAGGLALRPHHGRALDAGGLSDRRTRRFRPGDIHRERAPDKTPHCTCERARLSGAPRRGYRDRGTREAEMGKQKGQGGGAGDDRRAQGPAAEARRRDPQAQRPLRVPAVPKAGSREVEPAQPRAGRDSGAHHRAPRPLRGASRSLTTARNRGYPGRSGQLLAAPRSRRRAARVRPAVKSFALYFRGARYGPAPVHL